MDGAEKQMQDVPMTDEEFIVALRRISDWVADVTEDANPASDRDDTPPVDHATEADPPHPDAVAARWCRLYVAATPGGKLCTLNALDLLWIADRCDRSAIYKELADEILFWGFADSARSAEARVSCRSVGSKWELPAMWSSIYGLLTRYDGTTMLRTWLNPSDGLTAGS